MEDGATNVDIVQLATRLEVGQKFWFYCNCVRGICQISVDAEREFSIVSRLRTCFRKSLFVHLPALVRICQSRTLGVPTNTTLLDDNFLRDVVKQNQDG